MAAIRGVAPVRAFVDIVTKLCSTPDYQWVDFYDAFWKRALISPILNHSRVHRGDEVMAFDCFEKLVETKGPKFMLDFSQEPFTRVQLETRRGFFDLDTKTALGEHRYEVLTKLATPSAGRRRSKVEIGICFSATDLPASVAQELLALLKDVSQRRHSHHSELGPMFEITTIWIPGFSMKDPF
uniref:Uncharacterized protein n=1 Tax=Globisporangium ultimum (strain ATCC 200006 / CBS 805.95 / DAOM BR144) TaxID=431595 RepID=K3WVJ3_GLOUD